MAKYVLGIDQSTQGTKALLFDEEGALLCRTDLPHRQIINDLGWVEHDPEEIYKNTIQTVKNLVEKAGIDKADIAVLGISNQRETAMVWDKETGKPVYNAVVWQCARGEKICERIAAAGCADLIRERTGLPLSPCRRRKREKRGRHFMLRHHGQLAGIPLKSWKTVCNG